MTVSRRALRDEVCATESQASRLSLSSPETEK